jgi:ribosomal protein S18 acetylase RimI-like enzyme
MPVASSFVLRAERPGDLRDLSALLVAVDASWGDAPFRVAVRDGGIDAALAVISRPKRTSVVAEVDGVVVGYGALRQEAGALMLVNMLVAPQRQGTGIGRAIVAELCQPAVDSGRHVHLDVLLDSQAAYALYRSFGFQEFAVTIGKLSGREGRLMCLAPAGTQPCATGQHESS